MLYLQMLSDTVSWFEIQINKFRSFTSCMLEVLRLMNTFSLQRQRCKLKGIRKRKRIKVT